MSSEKRTNYTLEQCGSKNSHGTKVKWKIYPRLFSYHKFTVTSTHKREFNKTEKHKQFITPWVILLASVTRSNNSKTSASSAGYSGNFLPEKRTA